MNPVILIGLGHEIVASTDLTLPDITDSVWSYASMLITWPPVLAVIGAMIGLTMGAWVWGKISEVLARRG
jgi:hypothetical protein